MKVYWVLVLVILASGGCGGTADVLDDGNDNQGDGFIDAPDAGTPDGGAGAEPESGEPGEPEGPEPGEPEPGEPEPEGPNEPEAEPGPGRAAPVYEGSCPTFVEGRNRGFESGGLDREFVLDLPRNPRGAPVVFAWHWLGGDAELLISSLGLGQFADREGAIVVAPESQGAQFEWRFLQGPQGNADLQLFEDLLACLSTQFEVDLDRIHATGHSAGGLWTSYLTMHEAQWLASTVSMSGGTDERMYTRPARPIPVLIIWGGEGDTYGGFNFADASRVLSRRLVGDGHFVAHCVHSQGHRPPPNARDLVWSWFEAHPAGIEVEPFEEGLPSSWPSICALP